MGKLLIGPYSACMHVGKHDEIALAVQIFINLV